MCQVISRNLTCITPFGPCKLCPSVHTSLCRHAIPVRFTDGKTKAVTSALPQPFGYPKYLALYQKLPITSMRGIGLFIP